MKDEKENKQERPKFSEPRGDFWEDRERVEQYAKAWGLNPERVRQYVADWESDALRRCDRLYYPDRIT